MEINHLRRSLTACFLQKYVWKGELHAGSYYLLPFTSGCKLKKRNKKNMSGKSVQLINRTDTDEIDLSRELRSVWTCVTMLIILASYQKFILACWSSGHREALSDIFDMMDVDGNGLLSLEEYNFLELRTSGEKCDKDAWLVCKGHHFSMTHTLDVCGKMIKEDLQELISSVVFVGRAENFDMRKNQLTRQGFMELNLMETTEKDGDPADLWVSLEAVGYNRMLELVHVGISPLQHILAWFYCKCDL